jgi:hypothetical protein
MITIVVDRASDSTKELNLRSALTLLSSLTTGCCFCGRRCDFEKLRTDVKRPTHEELPVICASYLRKLRRVLRLRQLGGGFCARVYSLPRCLLIHCELSNFLIIQPTRNHLLSSKAISILFEFHGGTSMLLLRPRRNYLLAVHGPLSPPILELQPFQPKWDVLTGDVLACLLLPAIAFANLVYDLAHATKKEDWKAMPIMDATFTICMNFAQFGPMLCSMAFSYGHKRRFCLTIVVTVACWAIMLVGFTGHHSNVPRFDNRNAALPLIMSLLLVLFFGFYITVELFPT